MLLLFLLCVFGIWLYWGYLSVMQKRNATFDCYEDIVSDLRKRYELVTNIIALSEHYLPNEKSLAAYINKLHSDIIKLDKKPDFINRRIALDKEYENKADELIKAIKSCTNIQLEESLKNSIAAYEEVCKKICLTKKNFNQSAKMLRKAVEIFPSSFMARLNNVKSIDYMK